MLTRTSLLAWLIWSLKSLALTSCVDDDELYVPTLIPISFHGFPETFSNTILAWSDVITICLFAFNVALVPDNVDSASLILSLIVVAESTSTGLVVKPNLDKAPLVVSVISKLFAFETILIFEPIFDAVIPVIPRALICATIDAAVGSVVASYVVNNPIDALAVPPIVKSSFVVSISSWLLAFINAVKYDTAFMSCASRFNLLSTSEEPDVSNPKSTRMDPERFK